MLKRKYTIQKSIRFDEQLAKDLEFLASELDRTQNDLVNLAVEDLIHDNSPYFKKLMVVDELFDFFEGCSDDGYFESKYMKIKVWVTDDEYWVDSVFFDENGEKVDSYKTSFSDIDNLRKYLMNCALQHIPFNSEEAKKYLELRLDYK